MTAALPPPDDADRWSRPLYERLIAVVGQLSEAGLEIALAIKDEALALAAQDSGVEPGVLEGLTRAYGRASRATRLSVMLQARLIKDLMAFEAGGPPERRPILLGHGLASPDGQDRERADREYPDRERPDREELDREDLSPILSRPIGEQIAFIRQELGLQPEMPEMAADEAGWPLVRTSARSSNAPTDLPSRESS